MIARREAVGLAGGVAAAAIFGADACFAQAVSVSARDAVIAGAIANFNRKKAGSSWDAVSFFLHRNSVGVRIELVGCQHFSDVSFAQVSVEPATTGQIIYYGGTRYLMFKFAPANKIASVELLNG